MLCPFLPLLFGCLTAPIVRSGPLFLDVHISDPAQRFYIIDQLALWSPYCHREYERWARPNLSAEDRVLLEAHVRLRAAHGWGSGLDTAFMVDGAPAIAASGLTAEEVATEERVLAGLSPRVQPLLDAARPLLVATRARLAAELAQHVSTVRSIARFTGTRGRVEVPLFLIADPDPHDFGGGANGDTIEVEVASAEDPLPTVIHEVLHVFLRPWATDIAEQAATCGLDGQTVNEAIAYALAPGLVHGGRGDPLADAVGRFRANGVAMDDPYVRYERLALALRDGLDTALASRADLRAFLPEVCAAWSRVESDPWP